MRGNVATFRCLNATGRSGGDDVPTLHYNVAAMRHDDETDAAIRLGWLIQHARIWAGLSMTELAQDLGVDRGTVSRWESGDRYPHGRWHAPIRRSLKLRADAFDRLSEVYERPLVDFLLAEAGTTPRLRQAGNALLADARAGQDEGSGEDPSSGPDASPPPPRVDEGTPPR